MFLTMASQYDLMNSRDSCAAKVSRPMQGEHISTVSHIMPRTVMVERSEENEAIAFVVPEELNPFLFKMLSEEPHKRLRNPGESVGTLQSGTQV